MIIFYHKKTGQIVGKVDGRVHDPRVIKNIWVQPSNLSKGDIGKYVVPFKPVVRKGKVKELMPDVPFAEIITLFEEKTENLKKYKVKLDKKGKLIGFEKK